MKKYLLLCLLMTFAVYMGCQNTDNPVADSSQQGSTNTFDESSNDLAEAIAEFDQLRPQLEAEKAELLANYQQAAIVAKKKRSANSIAGSKITVPDDFPTIQDAVAAASPGDKIKVKESGSPYSGVVIIPVEDVRITAEGDVLLNGCFIVEADGVQIDHFNINGHDDPIDFGILLDGVSDVDIKDNTVFSTSSGIRVDSSEDCNIKNNNVSQSFVGILLLESTDIEVDENTVIGAEGGIVLEILSHDNTISGNNCHDNENGFALFTGSSENQFKDNKGNNNGSTGILVSDDCNNNTIGSDNEFNDNARVGIFLGSDTFENEIKKNEATGNDDFDIVDKGTDNEFKKNDTDVTDPLVLTKIDSF